jgi:hypothetical protein
MRYVRYADNVVQYAKLMIQKHDDVPVPARSEWTQSCPMPAPSPTIELTTTPPIVLRKREDATRHADVVA